MCINMHYRVVPDLLRAILPLLPLEKAGAGKKDRTSSSSSGKQPPTQRWDIVLALQELGTTQLFPSSAHMMSHSAWRLRQTPQPVNHQP